jgi:hypothetical protein
MTRTKSTLALHRRSLLKGLFAGSLVTLSLPPLEIMLNSHGTAFADGSLLPRRFMTWFFGNGVIPERWVPQAEGAGYELTDSLKPLGDLKPYCSLLSGFRNGAAEKNRRGHHDGVAGCFSGYPFIELPANGAPYASKFGGPSIDQVAAKVIGAQTYLPSLQMGVSTKVTKGEGPTLRDLSHKGPDQPLPAEFSPAKIYEKLFGSFVPKTDPSGPARVNVLDAVRQDAAELQKRLGTNDRLRLESHMESISQIQKQIQALPPICTVPEFSGVTNQAVDGKEPLEEVSQAMADLVALAFACDATRVISFLQAGSVAGTVYHMTGTTQTQHDLSHDGSSDAQEKVHQGVLFNMKCFAYLLRKLRDTPEGDGNLLDNSCILLGSDCTLGLAHSNFNQPIIVAGGGGGTLKHPGIHYKSPNKENLTDILLTCLQTVDPTATEAGGDEGYSNSACQAIKA